MGGGLVEQPEAAVGVAQVRVGETAEFRKTVGEYDIAAFAGLSGDFAPLHVDAEFMAATPYGQRIAHGALLVAYMSAAASRYCARLRGLTVSYGYDRIRFVRPVFIGDTVRVRYEVSEVDPQDQRIHAQITCTNQRGEVVAVATHILKFV